jgi:murein L,D-transpeptidase YcbB/YkuD
VPQINVIAVTGLLILISTVCLGQPVPEGVDENLRDQLRRRIEHATVSQEILVGQETIRASLTLPQFYELRSFRPAWSSEGTPTAPARILSALLSDAASEGLRPDDYHTARLSAILETLDAAASPATPSLLVDLDLLLTDAFLVYASHLLAGRVDPETFDREWVARRRARDIRSVLDSALETGRVQEALDQLRPQATAYRRLRDVLARYRWMADAGGWRPVPGGPALRKDNSGERVGRLSDRLKATGDLDPAREENRESFDDVLEQAVKTFQLRHGLDDDGVVGPSTLAALNVPVEQRIEQIELNLERWRWLPQSLGERHLLVNIPEFMLHVFEGETTVLDMRVVIGREARRTPVFSDAVRYIVLNPFWEIPNSIATRDILPLARKDPGYLERQRIRLLTGWGEGHREVEPASVNWRSVSSARFPYRLRQDPGPQNALGRIKFMFPNKFNVYLHDTNARELFDEPERGFSSGCIRVERPVDLAEYLLKDSKEWTRETILAALETARDRPVYLPSPVPVHILYWTAWTGEDGSVRFRRDLYGRDERLREALRAFAGS